MLDQMTHPVPVRRAVAASKPVQRGLTVVELLLTMSIIAILVAVAVPSMYEFIMRKRVESIADELISDVRYARSMLARNNQTAKIKFGRTESETCYVVYHPVSILDCDCTASPVCSSLGPSTAVELKTVRIPASSHVTLAPEQGTSSLLQFDAPTGLPAAGGVISISIQASPGGEVRLTTSQTGRPQLCSVSGHAAAYPACVTE